MKTKIAILRNLIEDLFFNNFVQEREDIAKKFLLKKKPKMSPHPALWDH